MQDPHLAALLARPMAPVAPVVRAAIDAGPIAAGQALPRDAVAGLLARILNRPALHRRLVPDAAPRAMADHCAREYANLAAILPGLHARYGG